jgi:hypothetical protein
MTRISSTVFIVLMLLNASAGIMVASGLSDDLGVTLAPGVSEKINELTDKVEQGFSPSSGLGETLFTLFIAAILVFQLILDGVTLAPVMLTNMGFPPWLILPMFAPMYVIGVLELIYVGTGRDTI